MRYLLLPLLVAPSVGRAQDYWVLSTRDSPQLLGSDPLLRACRLESGRFVPRDPDGIVASGRPVVFLVHGSYLTAKMATSEGLSIRRDLACVLPRDALVVEFDWPSQLTHANPLRDANEKARRAYVAGYHLARFLQRFPEGSRVSLVGHSHGALAVFSAMQLLAGGVLEDGCEATVTVTHRLRLRAVVIAPACDRHWLYPGERLGRALAASQGVLCLYNRLDPALVTHPLGRYSEHEKAMGKVGAGASLTRYVERDIAPLIGPRHTFKGTVPHVAAWMGPYLRD